MNKNIFFLLIILLSSKSFYAQDYERYKKLTDTTLTSAHLGFDKNITVTVPFEWQADLDRDFPLIIIFDRQNERSQSFMLNTIDYLTGNEQMPSAIIISVESTQNYRYLETQFKTSDEKGLAEKNEKFIFDELIPLVEEKYKASRFRMLVGHSRYGYFTTSLLTSRAEDLSAVISISPFYKQANVDLTDSIAKFQNLDFTSVKYYRFGMGNDYPEDFHIMDATLHLLVNPSLDAKGTLFAEADHNVTPGLILGTSLYEIFEFWSHAQREYISDAQTDLSVQSSLSTDIGNHYGSSLEFSLGILNGKGWALYNEKQYDKAIEAWEIMMQSYPNFSEGYLYILQAQVDLGTDGSETIARFKESLEKSKIYDETERIELLQELESMME